MDHDTLITLITMASTFIGAMLGVAVAMMCNR